MNTPITPANAADYDELLELWEASVRTTHRFLTEEDIRFYRPLVRKALPDTELFLIRNNRQKIGAFIGIAGKQVEMLFVHPGEQGKGYGRRLMEFAGSVKQARHVDVNEQNTEAFRFYRHLGFRVVGREPTDPAGRPFPILHLQWMQTPDLLTPRLLLRPFVPSDAETLFACCRNPKLGDNAGWKPHETPEESEEVLRTVFLGQENVWALVRKENGRLIGSAGLLPDPKRENPQAYMLGYWLDENYWGKGYMSESVQAILRYGFGNLGLHLITAHCYSHNPRSQHVLERAGFHYEGTLHQAVRTGNGQVYDLLCYYLPRQL